MICNKSQIRDDWFKISRDTWCISRDCNEKAGYLVFRLFVTFIMYVSICFLLVRLEVWFMLVALPVHFRYYFSRLMTKRTKWPVRPAKTQISLGIRPVWSEPSLSAWRKVGPLAPHWAHSEDSNQAGRMPRLIRVFAGRTVILLVLTWGGSF